MRRTAARRIRTIVATLAVGALAASGAVVLAAAPALAAAPTGPVVINEVEANGGTPGDWVELYNASGTAIDIGGWQLLDGDTTHVRYEIPADTSIAADGYFLIEEAQFDWGLGKTNETVTLFGADHTSVVDTYSWVLETLTTDGRCANGTGEFTNTVSSTKGAANACPTPVDPAAVLKINEVESNGGTPVDWIELYNSGAEQVDAGGLVLGDSGAAEFVIAPGTLVPAHGYVAIDVDVADAVNPGNFGLGATDEARLYDTDGTTLLDSTGWTGGHVNPTWGRCPDGTGAFGATASSTKGAVNDCPVVTPPTDPGADTDVVINEVESNGGTPGDWVELYNAGTGPVDLTGWQFIDGDSSHTRYTVPTGTIAAGGYFLLEEAQFGFGLGTPETVTLYADDTTTVIDTHSWGPHSPTTFARCPNGTGGFVDATSSTKGAVNDCSLSIRINEIESDGGVPGDWIELTNIGVAPVSVAGLTLRDGGSYSFTLPAGTIPAGGFVAYDVSSFGDADSARLFAADGTTLIDSYTWTTPASTTYGRCPDGTGAFTTTLTSTKGAENACLGDVPTETWPGGTEVAPVDAQNFFGEDMSGLDYEPSSPAGARGTLWAVNNGSGVLFKLAPNGFEWVPAGGEWAAGKQLRYAGGVGIPDSEGVTVGGGGSASGVYVATERDNDASGTSRPSILRFDPTASGTSLTATNEWNLAADLPTVGANAGLEGITWVPDALLTSRGFIDEHTNAPYVPANYANHAGGLFFVALEANGTVYAYALDHVTGDYTRIATIVTPGTMDLDYEAETGLLWAVCDEVCDGESATLRIATSGPNAGHFEITNVFANPVGMDDTIANEGFAIATQDLCEGGRKPVWYADDAGTDGYALRAGTIDCLDLLPEDPTDPTDPTDPGTDPTPPTEADLTPDTKNDVTGPATANPGDTITVTVGGDHVGDQVDGWILSTPVFLGTKVVAANGTIQLVLPLSMAPGAHRIAVLDDQGNVIGWFDLQLRPLALGATGVETDTTGSVALALALLALGALLVGTRRLRRVRKVAA